MITSPFNDSSQGALWGVRGEEDPKWKMPIKVGNLLEQQPHHHKPFLS